MPPFHAVPEYLQREADHRRMGGWIERLHVDDYMEKMSFISYPLASCTICFVSKQRQWVMPCNSVAVPQLFTSNSPSPSILLCFQSAPGVRLLLFKEKQLSIPCLICSFCAAVAFASMRASRFQHKVAGGKAFSKMGSLPH